MNKLERIIIGVILTLNLFGCIQTHSSQKFANHKNCEAESNCLLNAIKNNCENSYVNIRSSGKLISPDQTLEIVITNKDTYCQIFSETRNSYGQRTDSNELNLKLPLEECTKNEYKDLTSKCWSLTGISINLNYFNA